MVNLNPDIITVALNPAIDKGVEVPNFRIGAHIPCKTIFRRPAGKAVNVARVLDTIKVPSILIGFVGKNQQKYFESSFANKIVAPQLFAIDFPTRENITIVDPINKIETHLRERTFRVTSKDIAKLKKKLELLSRKGTIVAFCGSLPENMQVEDFLELIKICQSRGAKVCIDSGGEILRATKNLHPWLIKPNKEEISEMFERSFETYEEIVEASDKLLEVVSVVIITAGKDGAYLLTKEAKYYGYIPIDQSEVKNTVGCGDALLAGFLAEYIKGYELKECFTFALSIATASALSLTPAEIDLEKAKSLTSKVILKEL